jgi:hypothetical protein
MASSAALTFEQALTSEPATFGVSSAVPDRRAAVDSG